MRSLLRFGGTATIALALLSGACSKNDKPDPPPPNQIPNSNAGSDQSVFKAATVTLDGSASTDPDGNPLAYRWTQTSGPTVSLNNGTTARPTFTAPAQSGTVVFSLVVNDGHVDSPADTIQVTIANRAPAANAGADAIIEAGTLFTLDALASSDADLDPLTYTWTQLSGPAVTLTTIAAGRARFTAPVSATRLEFGLVANDGEVVSAQDVVVVNVQLTVVNVPPVAYVDSDYTLAKRAGGWLNGGGYDPDGFSLTYRWTQVSGPSVTLTGATSPWATFTAPAQPAVLEFELVVSDGLALSAPERIVVTVQNYAPQLADVLITPGAPRTADDLVVGFTSDDPDGDPITLSYAWKRNGVLVPAMTGSTYPASLTTRDDEIVATVTASDGTEAVSVAVSTVIQDSPPTLSATPPGSVDYGDMFSFQVNVGSDPDGDPVGPFEVKLGPARFTVSNGGAVSWQALLPMFDDHVDVAWDIGLSNAPSATLSGTVRVNHAARQMPLVRSGVTVPQHHDAIVIADLDANGVGDILVTDGRTLAVFDKAGANYVESWSYPFNLSGPENGVSAIAAADVAGDNNLEIFTSADNRIRQLRGGARTQAYVYDDPQIGTCAALRVADLDGDGHKELLCLALEDSYYNPNGASSILVLNAADLTVKTRINQTGLGQSLAVGNVDSDPALEIVTGGGFVYDGATLQNEWAHGPQFGAEIDTGDIDGDGVQEIAGTNGVNVYVFSAVSRSLRWQFASTACCGIGDLRLFDVDGDNHAEVLVGSTFVDGLTVWKFNSGTQIFAAAGNIASQDYEVTGLGVGNVDGDAAPEFIWGTGVAHSGQDVLVVGEYTGPNNITLEWTSRNPGQFDGPFVGGMLARTAPATSRLIFLSPSTSSGYGGTRLFGLDPATGATSSSSELSPSYSTSSTLDVADTDGDAIDEVVVTASNYSSSFYATYDFGSDALEWTSPAAFSTAVAITHADFTGDGRPEVVALGGDARVTVFNVAQSNIVWQSPALTTSALDVDVADLDHDGQLEIIVLTSQNLYVFGRASSSAPFVERSNVTLAGGGNLLVADTDGDGELEIFATVSNSIYYDPTYDVRVFDRTLQQLRTLPLSERITNLILEPSTDGRKNLLISTGGNSGSYWWTSATEIWAIDPVSGAGVWRSPELPGEFSRASLHAIDVNLDGQYELSFGTSVGAFVTR